MGAGVMQTAPPRTGRWRRRRPVADRGTAPSAANVGTARWRGSTRCRWSPPFGAQRGRYRKESLGTTRDFAEAVVAATKKPATRRQSKTGPTIGRFGQPVVTPERASFPIPTPLSPRIGGREPSGWGVGGFGGQTPRHTLLTA